MLDIRNFLIGVGVGMIMSGFIVKGYVLDVLLIMVGLIVLVVAAAMTVVKAITKKKANESQTTIADSKG